MSEITSIWCEYKVLQLKANDLQKILNQWKHQYEFEIISTTVENEIITMVIKRIGKEE